MSHPITQFTNDGLTFDVLDEGPSDGPPVVLLHGFPERSSSWRHVAPLLHAAGFRTLAPDQRGYSRGARPSRRRDYTLRRLVGDVVALVERVGGPVHLVGHDWGASVAWSVAALRPDLVRTLTAVSVPHPAAFVEAMLSSSQLAKSWYMGLFQLPWLPEWAAHRPGGQFERALLRGGMTGPDVERFRAEIVEDGALPYALNWYRAIPFLDPGATGQKVRVPTTHVWSDHDVALARRGADRTEDWVDAPYELVVLEGVTHWIPTQAPAALAEVILERITA
ncbi:alpha/beta fold hydrolase [Nocardioides caricicola]|uniref:Alpha/beta fold hydrolase n=1 Tax=Nocardioides caricicola TaxID=634770 RepID=A0ABW0N369_9ACTN